MHDIFRGLGVEVTLPTPEDFLKVRETLTRIGVASKRERVLYQSCHILHKRGRYGILHFKELFLMDGREAEFTDDDRGRRNTIAKLLSEWKLVNLTNPTDSLTPVSGMRHIKVVPFRDKSEWTLESKYTVGSRK
jgi:translational regulator